jgi:hypothetical protein
MLDIFTIVTKGQQALSVLKLLEPVLGENAKIVNTVTTLVGKALVGAKFGATANKELVAELDKVISDLEAIKERGGVTGDDFRAEIALIDQRGAELDAILARLKAG